MNISVSDDLKARMDRIKDDVNWSAIASRAFAEHCSKEETRLGKAKTMKDVIERMRGLQSSDDAVEMAEAMKEGLEWATKTASPAELRRLDKVWEEDRYEDSGEGNAYSAAEWFVFDIDPGRDGDREAAANFWSSIVGDDWDDIVTPKFVQAFARVARNVWLEVKEHL